MATAIYYSSSTGNTEKSAGRIRKNLSKEIKLVNISNDGFDNIEQYDKIILGSSTWGDGDLQDDWDEKWKEFCKVDFSGKTVALFGLGDQDSYADTFLDAMGLIYEELINKGANIIGKTSTDGYDFDESKAVVDGEFVGLALDEDNQSDLSKDRIAQWCETIKTEIL